MAKLTDALVVTLQGFFDAGDQPTEANFDALILAIQEGIEEHDHSGTGDGDGTGTLVGPVGIGSAPNATFRLTVYTEAERGLYVHGDGLDFATDYIGAYFRFIKDAGASDHDDNYYGAYYWVGLSQAAGEVGNMYGQLLYATLTDGNVGDVVNTRHLMGQICTANLDGGKVWGNAIGLRASIDQEAANEVTGDVIGLQVNVDAEGTIGGDVILLQLDEDDHVDWAIRQVGGAAPSFLTGNLALNTLAGGGNQDVGADNTGKLYVPFASDRKLKDNIELLTGGLDVVRQLRGVTFDWNPEELALVGLDFGESGQQIGLIAQEVVEAIPAAANKGKDYQSYRKETITPYLIEAIKELDTRLTQLEGK